MADSVALAQVLREHEQAKRALQQLENATDLAAAEQAWLDLLCAASRIYSKLEQAAKRSPRATEWFSEIKQFRRTDALLGYIHKARNTHEHTIDEITTKVQSGSATIRFREPYDPAKLEGKRIRIGTDRSGHVIVDEFDPEIFEVVSYARGGLVLNEIVDVRSRMRHQPPQRHLGRVVEDQSPLGVAALTVDYLTTLISGAREAGI